MTLMILLMFELMKGLMLTVWYFGCFCGGMVYEMDMMPV